MEFEVKPKTHYLKIGEQKHAFRSPKPYELEELTNQMEAAKDTPGIAPIMELWYAFFAKLGLPKEVLRELDYDTMTEFSTMVISGKNA